MRGVKEEVIQEIPINITSIAIPYKNLKKFNNYAIRRRFLFEIPVYISVKGKIPVEYAGVNIYTFLLVNETPLQDYNMKLVKREDYEIVFNEINKQFEEHITYLKSIGEENINIGKIRKQFYEVINVYVPILRLAENDDKLSLNEVYDIYYISSLKVSAQFGISKLLKELFPREINEEAKFSKLYFSLAMDKRKNKVIKKPASFTYKGLKLINVFLKKEEVFKQIRNGNGNKDHFEDFKYFESKLQEIYKNSERYIYPYYDEISYMLINDKNKHLPFYFFYTFSGQKKEGIFLHIDGKAKEFKFKDKNLALYDFYYRGYDFVIF